MIINTEISFTKKNKTYLGIAAGISGILTFIVKEIIERMGR
jgi:hypothetical protein